MAYAAVISPTNTRNSLLYYSPPDSISSRCRNLLQSAHSLKKILNRLQCGISDSSIRESSIRRSRSTINALNDELREAASRLEDLLDTLLSEQIRIAQSGENSTSDNLEEVLKQESFSVIVGMAGIGKTALARRIFEDPSVRNHFQRRAFVTVGQKYRREEILQAVVSQLYPDIREGMNMTKRQLRRSSHGNKRYLIVVDDIWSVEVGIG